MRTGQGAAAIKAWLVTAVFALLTFGVSWPGVGIGELLALATGFSALVALMCTARYFN